MKTVASPAAGFTLLELLVVMGILSGFLLMLVQLVDAGLRLFDEGEAGQALADRATSAQWRIGDELQRLQGPVLAIEPGPPQSRLLVQPVSLGLGSRPAAGTPVVPFVRADVWLEPERELEMLAKELRARAIAELGAVDEATLQRRIDELAAVEPLRGRGHLWLVPFPEAQAPGAAPSGRQTLRAAWFLPGQQVPLDRDQSVDPRTAMLPGSQELPASAVYNATQDLVADLLYFGIALWSQRTRSWAEGAGPGPESVWDSARAGWLSDPARGPTFGLDVGAWSLDDPTDDVFPHALRITLVVAQPEAQRPEGFLAGDLGADETTLWLLDGSRFPGRADGGFVKVGHEWIRYQSQDGDRLEGLRRGQRGTKAMVHPEGSRVHIGRTVEFTIALPNGKDDFNG